MHPLLSDVSAMYKHPIMSNVKWNQRLIHKNSTWKQLDVVSMDTLNPEYNDSEGPDCLWNDS